MRTKEIKFKAVEKSTREITCTDAPMSALSFVETTALGAFSCLTDEPTFCSLSPTGPCLRLWGGKLIHISHLIEIGLYIIDFVASTYKKST